ncbi:DUF2939 domain-containing protein [Desulfovibrio inopinatus]|uniref:DUF2939 domain-containing protein n=1 Tax=Desulfovibrio inopinatus TaxID=102109 RepID=UPI000404D26C|nr:DUF2939 domain-containing protein [Desulfovibrio inopinatus]
MNRAIGIAICLILFILGWLYYYQPYDAAIALENAVKNHDTKRLEELIDFNSLRLNFKSRLAESLGRPYPKERPVAEIINLGPGETRDLAVATVDTLLTPERIILVMQGKWIIPGIKITKETSGSPVATPDATPIFNKATYDYAAISKFVIIAHPTDSATVRYILKREGFHWKVIDIEII